MASALTQSRSSIKLGDRLRRLPALAAKVRRLDDELIKIFGTGKPVEWDLVPRESENGLSIHVGERGKGECTRWMLESLLDNTPWLKNVFVDMNECVHVVQQYLDEVEQLFQQIRIWISHSSPSYKIEDAPTTVEEAFTREYSAKKLVIRFKKKAVEVRPRGAWWITTEGRVDLVSENAEHQLILSRAEGGWLWVEESETVTLHKLTPELFSRLVKECMG